MKMKFRLYYLFFLFFACEQISTTNRERNQIIATVMNDQEKNSLSVISRCLIGGKYRIYNDYKDTLYLSNKISKIVSGFREEEVIKQYKAEYIKNKKIDFDTTKFFPIKRINDFDNKSPCSISLSQPIRYKNYYLLNLEYNDWASGKRIFYLLKQNSNGALEVVLQDLIRVN